MPIRNDFKTGEFGWVDLGAHDLEAAGAWYGEVFGWKAVNQAPEGAPPYSFFMRGEAPAAGGAQLSDEMKAQGIPPAWNSYVVVANRECHRSFVARHRITPDLHAFWDHEHLHPVSLRWTC